MKRKVVGKLLLVNPSGLVVESKQHVVTQAHVVIVVTDDCLFQMSSRTYRLLGSPFSRTGPFQPLSVPRGRYLMSCLRWIQEVNSKYRSLVGACFFEKQPAARCRPFFDLQVSLSKNFALVFVVLCVDLGPCDPRPTQLQHIALNSGWLTSTNPCLRVYMWSKKKRVLWFTALRSSWDEPHNILSFRRAGKWRKGTGDFVLF